MGAIGVHQGNQDALAQAAIGHAHALGGPFAPYGFENRAAGQDQVSAVAPDAGMGHAAIAATAVHNRLPANWRERQT